ncbi:ATP-binding protein [Aeromonas caviae]|uniref:ATP-binding protein n=1 Tax=Aeromonas caviae TaxID=648 RepID=UPI00068ECFFF|nr:ATP-binding protein [Aeromonas caviae]
MTKLTFMTDEQINALMSGEGVKPESCSVTALVAEGTPPREVVCQTHGPYLTRIQGIRPLMARLRYPDQNTEGMVEEVDCCEACAEASRQNASKLELERRDEAWRQRAGRNWLTRCQHAGISERELGWTLGGLVARSPEQQKAMDHGKAIIKAIKEGTPAPSLVMLGKPGTGKSLIASATMASALALEGEKHSRLTAAYTTASGMFRQIRATWDRKSEQTEGQVLDHLTSLDLLVIDEMGVQAGSENEMQLMFEVLDGRHRNMKPTVFLSNLPFDELKLYLGERVISRLRQDGGKVIAFNGDDQRTRAA